MTTIDEIRARWDATKPWTGERRMIAMDHASTDIAALLAALDAKDAELRAVERERDEARAALDSIGDVLIGIEELVPGRDAQYAIHRCIEDAKWRKEPEFSERPASLRKRIADLESKLARAKAEGAREALERAAETFRGYADGHIDRSNSFVVGDSRVGGHRVRAAEAARCAAYCADEAARLAGEEAGPWCADGREDGICSWCGRGIDHDSPQRCPVDDPGQADEPEAQRTVSDAEIESARSWAARLGMAEQAAKRLAGEEPKS